MFLIFFWKIFIIEMLQMWIFGIIKGCTIFGVNYCEILHENKRGFSFFFFFLRNIQRHFSYKTLHFIQEGRGEGDFWKMTVFSLCNRMALSFQIFDCLKQTLFIYSTSIILKSPQEIHQTKIFNRSPNERSISQFHYLSQHSMFIKVNEYFEYHKVSQYIDSSLYSSHACVNKISISLIIDSQKKEFRHKCNPVTFHFFKFQLI